MSPNYPLCPDNRDDCRLWSGHTTATAMAWTPEFDRDGRALNRDPNTYTMAMGCRTCGRNWVRVETAGRITFAVEQGFTPQA